MAWNYHKSHLFWELPELVHFVGPYFRDATFTLTL